MEFRYKYIEYMKELKFDPPWLINLSECKYIPISTEEYNYLIDLNPDEKSNLDGLIESYRREKRFKKLLDK